MPKRIVTAPFEVGRSVILGRPTQATFCGAAAVRGFRDAWSVRQKSAEVGAGRVPHPALTGYEVPILGRDEVAVALTVDVNTYGEPVYDYKKAERLIRKLKPVVKKSKPHRDIPTITRLATRLDEEAHWNISLPLTEEEVGEVADQLHEERRNYLEVLFEVTDFIPTRNVPIAMNVARLGVGLAVQIQDLRWETQRALDTAHEVGLESPLGTIRLEEYNLKSAQIWD